MKRHKNKTCVTKIVINFDQIVIPKDKNLLPPNTYSLSSHLN